MPIEGREQPSKVSFAWMISSVVIQIHAVVCLFVGELLAKRRIESPLPETQKLPDDHIVVVRLDEIGDIVLMTGFLKELRKLYPAARITLVVKDALLNLVERCPHVDEVIPFAAHCSRVLRPFVLPFRAAKMSRKLAWEKRPTLGIQPRWDTDSSYAGLLLYLLRARRRIGFSEQANRRKSYFNKGFDRFYTDLVDGNEVKHEIEHNLDVIRYLGGDPSNGKPESWITEEDIHAVELLLKNSNVPTAKSLIAIAPGAGHPRRMWPLDHYSRIGVWLSQQFDADIIIVGGLRDVRLGDMLASRIGTRSHNLSGRTSLRETCALFKKCRLFIGNDSGPLHLAAASGIPVIEISCHPEHGDESDLQSPVRFGPRSAASAVLQPAQVSAPCRERCSSSHAHCINGVTVERVKEAVKRVLAQGDQK